MPDMTGQDTRSIITRLRLLIENMDKVASQRNHGAIYSPFRQAAESLLPISLVDDVQAIVLREAADIVDAAGKGRMAMDLREVAAGMAKDG